MLYMLAVVGGIFLAGVVLVIAAWGLFCLKDRYDEYKWNKIPSHRRSYDDDYEDDIEYYSKSQYNPDYPDDPNSPYNKPPWTNPEYNTPIDIIGLDMFGGNPTKAARKWYVSNGTLECVRMGTTPGQAVAVALEDGIDGERFGSYFRVSEKGHDEHTDDHMFETDMTLSVLGFNDEIFEDDEEGDWL